MFFTKYLTLILKKDKLYNCPSKLNFEFREKFGLLKLDVEPNLRGFGNLRGFS